MGANNFLTSSENSGTLWLVSSLSPPAQRLRRQCAAGELTPGGTRAGQRAGSILRCHPHMHIHYAPTGCKHTIRGKKQLFIYLFIHSGHMFFSVIDFALIPGDTVPHVEGDVA